MKKLITEITKAEYDEMNEFPDLMSYKEFIEILQTYEDQLDILFTQKEVDWLNAHNYETSGLAIGTGPLTR